MGKAWHVVQYPASDTPVRAAKSDRKAADVVKRARKLARRLAALTPEQRARYEAWRRAHAPGPSAARSAARRTAAQNQATRELLARPDAPGSRDADIAEVEMFLAQMKREQAAAERAWPLNDDGVFG